MFLQQAADVLYRLISLKSEILARIPCHGTGVSAGVGWTDLEPLCRIKNVLQGAVGVEPRRNLRKDLLAPADTLAGSKPHALQTSHRGDQFAGRNLKRLRKRFQRPRLRYHLSTLDLAHRDPRQLGPQCERRLGELSVKPQPGDIGGDATLNHVRLPPCQH